ncbi:MAG: CoA transferase [Bacteroidetes bacterium]|nr:CoA transferase [Bacteroidota bacterium]
MKAIRRKKQGGKKKPLSGIKVLELASVLAGPLVGTFLAELGAHVLKIENPATGGDVTRNWRMPEEDHNKPSAYYRAANQGKQNLLLDILGKSGKKILQELLRDTDIILVNFKPGDEKKFGLNYSTLKKKFPKLIYAQISGYGKKDPRPAFDLCLQAETGFMSMNGTHESGPLKMPLAMIDILSAHQLKEGILLALYDRKKNGNGNYVHVSLYDTAVISLSYMATNYFQTGKIPGLNGSIHPNIAPYGETFCLKDKKIMVLAIGNEMQFGELCTSLEMDSLVTDKKYSTNEMRVANRNELFRKLKTVIEKFSSAEIEKKLERKNIPFAFVRNIGEVLCQTDSTRLLVEDEYGFTLKSAAFIE